MVQSVPRPSNGGRQAKQPASTNAKRNNQRLFVGVLGAASALCLLFFVVMTFVEEKWLEAEKEGMEAEAAAEKTKEKYAPDSLPHPADDAEGRGARGPPVAEQDLEGALRDAGGAHEALYCSYFAPRADFSEPPRCNQCGGTVGAHRDSPPAPVPAGLVVDDDLTLCSSSDGDDDGAAAAAPPPPLSLFRFAPSRSPAPDRAVTPTHFGRESPAPSSFVAPSVSPPPPSTGTPAAATPIGQYGSGGMLNLSHVTLGLATSHGRLGSSPGASYSERTPSRGPPPPVGGVSPSSTTPALPNRALSLSRSAAHAGITVDDGTTDSDLDL